MNMWKTYCVWQSRNQTNKGNFREKNCFFYIKQTFFYHISNYFPYSDCLNICQHQHDVMSLLCREQIDGSTVCYLTLPYLKYFQGTCK